MPITGSCTKTQALATAAPKRVGTSGARVSGNHGHPCLQKQHVNDRKVSSSMCLRKMSFVQYGCRCSIQTSGGLCWYLLYMWILIKKNAKAHSSRFILLWYQLIFCNDFEKTWKKGVFLLRFCILQSIADVFYNVFGNESESLYIDIFYVLSPWHLLDPFRSSGLDFTYYVCIISSWKYLF